MLYLQQKVYKWWFISYNSKAGVGSAANGWVRLPPLHLSSLIFMFYNWLIRVPAHQELFFILPWQMII